MARYLALLRGINVSGQKLIKMDALRRIFEAHDCAQVKTYIQTGNVLFSHPEIDAEKIREQVEQFLLDELGYKVPTLIREPSEMLHILDRNPFSDREGLETKQIYIAFLDQQPTKEAVTDLESMSSADEEVIVVGKEAWLYYKNGAGKAKITNVVLEKKLKVTATSRNWNSTSKLNDLLQNF